MVSKKETDKKQEVNDGAKKEDKNEDSTLRKREGKEIEHRG